MEAYFDHRNWRLHPLIHTLLELDLVRDVADIKNAKPKLRSVLWKVISPLNSLYYLVVVKNRHFEPHAESS